MRLPVLSLQVCHWSNRTVYICASSFMSSQCLCFLCLFNRQLARCDWLRDTNSSTEVKGYLLCFCSPTFKFSGRKALVIRLNLSDLPNRKIDNIKNIWCTGRFDIDVTNEPNLDENLAFPVDQMDCLITENIRCDMCELAVKLADTRTDKSSAESLPLRFDKAASYFLWYLLWEKLFLFPFVKSSILENCLRKFIKYMSFPKMPNFPRQNKLIDSVYHRFKTNIYIN